MEIDNNGQSNPYKKKKKERKSQSGPWNTSFYQKFLQWALCGLILYLLKDYWACLVDNFYYKYFLYLEKVTDHGLSCLESFNSSFFFKNIL